MVILGLLPGVSLKIVQHRTGGAPATPPTAISRSEKMSWRMPQLVLLQPVRWSAGTKLGMLAYLVVGAVLLAIKAVQLSGA